MTLRLINVKMAATLERLAPYSTVALVVPVAEHASCDELVETLAGRAPAARDPRTTLQQAALNRRERIRAICPLVLEQMTQILACEQTKQAAAMSAVPGNLKIDECRPPVGKLQPIRLLGQIIVDNATTSQSLEQRMRLAKEFWVVWTRLLHRRTGHETAIQNGSIPDNQLGDVIESRQGDQDLGLARGRNSRDPAHAESRRTHIAADPAVLAINDDFDTAQRIGLEQFGWHGGIIAAFVSGGFCNADPARIGIQGPGRVCFQ